MAKCCRQSWRSAAVLLLGLAAVLSAAAQAASYTSSSGTFAWVDPAAHTDITWTAAPGGPSNQCTGGSAAVDDDISEELPLGFTFTFGAQPYSTVRVMSNGRLQFNNRYCGHGTSSVGPPRTYPFAYPHNSIVRTMKVYGADIDPSVSPNPGSGNPATVRYQSLAAGSCPNGYTGACFVVTWSDVSEWIAGGSPGQGNGSHFTYQAVLFDDGSFQYQYGASDNTTNGQAQIGWQLNTGNFAVTQTGFPANGTAIIYTRTAPLSNQFYLTTKSDEVLGGTAMEDEDIVLYDNDDDSAVFALDGDQAFASEEDIDALHRLDNGNFVLSTTGSASIGGLNFRDGDLVEYNPLTNTATLYFSENLFSGGADIDAVFVKANGNIVLSTDSSETLGGLSFEDGDVVEYDPNTDTAVLIFDEDLFSNGADVDGFHILDNGNFVLSTESNESLGGTSFKDGDLVQYDPNSGVATVVFSESRFSNGADINGVSVVEVPTVLPTPLAVYSFDESSWNGTAGEVIDSSGNGHHGTAVGTAQTVADGKVCRAGDYPFSTSLTTNHAVDTGLDFDSQIGTRGTIAFWYNSDNAWQGGGSRLLFDASSTLGSQFYFVLSLRDDGRLRYGIEDSSDDDFALNSPVQNFAADTWVHIAVTWSLVSDEMSIFINGNAVANRTFSSNGVLGDLFSLYIGDNRSTYTAQGSRFAANGRIDEFYIYTKVLNSQQVTDVMNLSHSCAVAGLDHFDISHDGNGINCQVEPVTITAHQADDTTETGFTGSIDLSTSTAHGDWSVVTGTNSITNNGNGSASYTFAAADNGQVVLGLKDTFVETTNINVSGSGKTEQAGEDPDLVFSAAGFQFLADSVANAIGTQVAGKDNATLPGNQALELQAIRTNDQTGACEAALAGNVSIDMAAECINPSSCAGQSVAIGGTGIGSNAAGAVSSYQAVSLDFGDATDTTASFTMRYADAGQIRLHARYAIPLAGGGASGNLMQGSSNSFVVRPFGFDIDFLADDRANNAQAAQQSYALDAADPDDFVKAGDPFSTTITAVVWEAGDDADNDGIPDPGADLTNNNVTPNFGNESSAPLVDISHSLVDPASGSAGALTGNDNIGGFSAGAVTTNLGWDEVGIVDLAANLDGGDYLGSGQDIQGNARNVGRFTPHHFTVDVAADGGVGNPAFAAGCGTFTYFGQPFNYAVNQAPAVTITARNAAGSTTVNYGDYSGGGDSNWWKLGDITESYADGGLLALLPDDGVVSHTPSTASASGPGFVTTVFDAPLVLPRPTAGNRAPYAAPQLSFSFAVADTDGVEYDDGDNVFTSNTIAFNGGAEQRQGRLRLVSAAGPEVAPLKVPLFAEYFDGSAFVPNSADNCTVINLASHLSLRNPLTAGGAAQTGTTAMTVAGGSTTASSSWASGDAGLQFSAPGDGNTGYVEIDVDISTAGSSPTWLQYNWSGTATEHNENPPGVRASFGLFNGSSRVIEVREPWN